MRKRLHIIVAAILLVSASGFGGEGKKYGKDLTVKDVTPLALILGNPEKYNGTRVLVEGTIAEVCQNMGCWIKISDASATTPIQFKVDDGVIEFPKDGKGKAVRGEGVVFVKTYSKEELIKQAKHEAEEQGKEFDPSTITGPKVVVRINGEGAVISEPQEPSMGK